MKMNTKGYGRKTISEAELDKMKSLQLPPSPNHISNISKTLHDSYHRLSDACAVCGQFCEENVWLRPSEVPKSFYDVLCFPEGKDKLHETIAQQYDVSFKFPSDPRFNKIMLNINGIKKIYTKNENNEEEESIQICICSQFGCLGSLKRGRVPKFAIAQGNYIGQLPCHLRNMTHASLSLIRPVQSFGYLISYREESGNEAALKLSGHMYSTRLETGMIRNKLPLKPEDVPIRVVVTSPGCTKENMIAKGKLALMKKDYLVEKEKIRETLAFFRKVNNPVMSEIEIDEEQINALPDGDVSDTIFMIDDSEPEAKKGKFMIVQIIRKRENIFIFLIVLVVRKKRFINNTTLEHGSMQKEGGNHSFEKYLKLIMLLNDFNLFLRIRKRNDTVKKKECYANPGRRWRPFCDAPE